MPNPTLQVTVKQKGLEKSIQQALRKVNSSKAGAIDFNTSKKSVESLSQPLGRITGQADEFTKSMGAANARVLAFGASVGIIGAVATSFKELVSVTILVEKQLTEINTILQASDQELSALKDTIFEVARNTANSFELTATAALELSRQGLAAAEVSQRLNDALILARLSGLDATAAVAGLTAAINSFNTAGITSSEVLNKISVAAQNAAVSDKDLIDGLKRSGSVAVATGVQFNELLGVIAALQEKTARGGAVIGNSLKTIFTRIKSAENLRTLEDLGIDVTNMNGELLSSLDIIKNVATELKTLPAGEQLNIAEGLVGKFQIAPFLALLEDLQKGQSRSAEIAGKAADATNEAYQRNIEQNKTIAALIAQTVADLSKLGNALGEVGVLEPVKNLLGIFNNLVGFFQKKLDGDGIGSNLAKGFVKGFSSVLFGAPGLTLIAAVIFSLTKDLVKFAFSIAKSFLQVNKAAKDIANTEGIIAHNLLNNEGLQRKILGLEGDRAAQARVFADALSRQVTLMRDVRNLSREIAPQTALLVNQSSSNRKTGTGAEGYVPNAVATEQSNIQKGVGGARAADKPVVIPNFNFGSGRKGTMVAHTGEYIVPNYGGGEGSAIFNRKMINKAGLPEGAQKISSSKGFIPNFVSVNEIGRSFPNIKAKLKQSAQGDGRLNPKDSVSIKGNQFAYLDAPIKKGESPEKYEARTLKEKGYKSSAKLFGGQNAAVDGYRGAYDLVEVKAGSFLPSDVFSKFLRAVPENYGTNNELDVWTNKIDNLKVKATLITPNSPSQKTFGVKGKDALKSSVTHRVNKGIRRAADGYVPNFAPQIDPVIPTPPEAKLPQLGKEAFSSTFRAVEGFIPNFAPPLGRLTATELIQRLYSEGKIKTAADLDKYRVGTSRTFDFSSIQPGLKFPQSHLTGPLNRVLRRNETAKNPAGANLIKKKLRAEKDRVSQIKLGAKNIPIDVSVFGGIAGVSPSTGATRRFDKTFDIYKDTGISKLIEAEAPELIPSLARKKPKKLEGAALKKEEKRLAKGGKPKKAPSTFQDKITFKNLIAAPVPGFTQEGDAGREQLSQAINQSVTPALLEFTTKIKKDFAQYIPAVKTELAKVAGSAKGGLLPSVAEGQFLEASSKLFLTSLGGIATAFDSKDEGRRFDFTNQKLNKTELGVDAQYVELKRNADSITGSGKNSVLKKTMGLVKSGKPKKQFISALRQSVPTAPLIGAEGFIPNFALPEDIANTIKEGKPASSFPPSKALAGKNLGLRKSFRNKWGFDVMGTTAESTMRFQPDEEEAYLTWIAGDKQYTGLGRQLYKLMGLTSEALGYKFLGGNISADKLSGDKTAPRVAKQRKQVAGQLQTRRGLGPTKIVGKSDFTYDTKTKLDPNKLGSFASEFNSSGGFVPNFAKSVYHTTYPNQVPSILKTGLKAQDESRHEQRRVMDELLGRQNVTYWSPTKYIKGFSELGAKFTTKAVDTAKVYDADRASEVSMSASRGQMDIAESSAEAYKAQTGILGNQNSWKYFTFPEVMLPSPVPPSQLKLLEGKKLGGKRSFDDGRFRFASQGFVPNFAAPKRKKPNYKNAISRLLATARPDDLPENYVKAAIKGGRIFEKLGINPEDLLWQTQDIDSFVLGGTNRLTVRDSSPNLEGNQFKYQLDTGLSRPDVVSKWGKLSPKEKSLSAAKGFVPNFTDPLKAAIGREVSAGVARNKVYIDQSPRLKTAGNPQGLAVANTRDEPAGVFQGINRSIRQGSDPKKAGGSAIGHVPNFAPEFAKSDLLGGFQDMNRADALDKATTDLNKKMQEALDPLQDKIDETKKLVKALKKAREAQVKSSNGLAMSTADHAAHDDLLAEQDKEIKKQTNELKTQTKNRQKLSDTLTREGAAREAAIKKETGGFFRKDKTTNLLGKERTISKKAAAPGGPRDLLGTVFAVQAALTALSGAVGEGETAMSRTADEALKFASSIATAAFAAEGFSQLGKSIGGNAGAFVGKLGAYGAIAAVAAGAIKSGISVYEDYSGITESAAKNVAKMGEAAIKAGFALNDLSKGEKLRVQNRTKEIIDRASVKTNTFKTREEASAFSRKLSEQGLATSGVRNSPNGTFQVQEFASFKANILGKSAIKESLAQGIPDAIAAGLKIKDIDKIISEVAFDPRREDDLITKEEVRQIVSNLSAAQTRTRRLPEYVEKFNFGETPVREGQGSVNEFFAGRGKNAELSELERRSGLSTQFPELRKKIAEDLKLDPNSERVDKEILKALIAQQKAAKEQGELIESANRDYEKRIHILRATQQITARNFAVTAKLNSTELKKLGKIQDINLEMGTTIKSRAKALALVNAQHTKTTSELKSQQAASLKLSTDVEGVIGKIAGLTIEDSFAQSLEAINKAVDAITPDRLSAIGQALVEGGNAADLLEEDVAAILQHFRDIGVAETGIKPQQTKAFSLVLADYLIALTEAGEKARNVFEQTLKVADAQANHNETLRDTTYLYQTNLDLLKKQFDTKQRLEDLETEALKPEEIELQKQIIKYEIDPLFLTNQTALERELAKIETQLTDSIHKFNRDVAASRTDLFRATREEIFDKTIKRKESKFGASKVTVNEQTLIKRDLEKLDTVAQLAKAGEEYGITAREINEELGLQELNLRTLLDIDEQRLYTEKELINQQLKERSSPLGQFGGGLEEGLRRVQKRAADFEVNLGVDLPQLFADNMSSAMDRIILQGESFGDTMRDAATQFLNTLNQRQFTRIADLLTGGFREKDETPTEGGILPKVIPFISNLFKGFNSGGRVGGGSGQRDDVPALLTGGEYVMNKQSVSKYGPRFFEDLNAGKVPKFAQGGLFAPGLYGQEEIKGKKDLLSFATQAYTGGKKDIISGGENVAVVGLEPESVRLTTEGRNKGTPLQRATEDAKRQSFDLFLQQVEQENQAKEQDKASKKAFINALLVAGVTALVSPLIKRITTGAQKGLEFAKTEGLGFTDSLKALFSGVKDAAFQGTDIFETAAPNTIGSSAQAARASSAVSRTASDIAGTSVRGDFNAPQLPNFGSFGQDSLFADSTDYSSDELSALLASLDDPRLSDFGNVRRSNQDLDPYKPNSSSGNIADHFKFATGGLLPSAVGTDTIPAMLSGGEYVVNQGATKRIGAENLQALNSGADNITTTETSEKQNDALIAKIDQLINVVSESGQGEINITVNSDGSSSETSQNASSTDKNLAQRIRDVVKRVIEEEKRLGGTLRRGIA